jgi:DNA-binding NtrC family response regulator
MVPPLRERLLDILPLGEFFAQAYAAVMGIMPPPLADDAKAALLRYPWPGNVRELKNTIERAAVLTSGSLIEASALKFDFDPACAPPAETATALPSAVNGASFSLPAAPPLNAAGRAEHLRGELARAERDRIIEAIAQAGNQAAAAKLLGLSRRALIYRLERYQIPRPRKGARSG